MQREKPNVRHVRLCVGAFSIGLVLCLLAGACNSPPGINPWRDDSIGPAAWTTPSEQGILAAGHEPALRHRDVPPLSAPLVAGDVPHYPLWWEDPFEDKGDEDGKFAWTWMDYFAFGYSYARSHLNTIAFPVSAIVTPPFTPMVSDGLVGPGPSHDATRGTSPDPTATAADFGMDSASQSANPAANSAPPPTTAPGT